MTSNDPLKCVVTYSVPSQDGFNQEYVYEHSTKYFVRELTATPAMQYSLVGSNDAIFVCTAKGDVTSLQWNVEGRTNVNENLVTVVLETTPSNVVTKTLTVDFTRKDEIFACDVTYDNNDTDSANNQLYAIGKFDIHLIKQFFCARIS